MIVLPPFTVLEAGSRFFGKRVRPTHGDFSASWEATRFQESFSLSARSTPHLPTPVQLLMMVSR